MSEISFKHMDSTEARIHDTDAMCTPITTASIPGGVSTSSCWRTAPGGHPQRTHIREVAAQQFLSQPLLR